MTGSAKLLSEPTNFAVVQLPGRKQPGVVVQLDTLGSLIGQMVRMKSLAECKNMSDLLFEIDEVTETPTKAQMRCQKFFSDDSAS